MIYLITGVPGSGKTLYAVSTLLQKLMKETVKAKDGSEIPRRLCIDGIPDLAIPHEVMASPPEVTMIQGKAQAPAPDGHGLWNWPAWCKPGDVIVVDEVQRYWRPRAMGTKPPEDVATLETHRHYGVDFVIITQSPMLLDQNVRRLVGRHLNVRRIFGGARALIYDWDGCQTDVHRTTGSTKTLWSYPKSAFKLYRSAELHTKQHQKIPLWMAFPLVVLALGIFAGPRAWSAMHGTMSGKGLAGAAAAPVAASSSPRQGAGGGAASVAPATPPAAPLPASQPAVAAAAPLGCIVYRGRCECFGSDGALLKVDPAQCREGALRLAGFVPLDVSHHEPPAVRALEPASAAASAQESPGLKL